MPPRSSPRSELLQLLMPDTSVGFDAEAFDSLIRSHGTKLVHFRSFRCPIGMTDRTDGIRGGHDPDDHPDCSHGFQYARGGAATCWFSGNTLEYKFEDVQRLDGSTVRVTIPRTYDDQPGVIPRVAPCDRFYLDEDRITVVHWETVQYHGSGIDRPSFPVVAVSDLMDNQGLRYQQDVDFDVTDRGRIRWIDGGRRPGIDPRTQRGRIYSIRYDYRPYWYVLRMEHEVRVAQVQDDLGDAHAERMPQAVLLQREYVYEAEDKDDSGPNRNNPRQLEGAPSGTFGPR